MSTEQRYDLAELERDVRENVRDIIGSGGDPEDAVYEAADATVPIYTYDLLRYAAETLWLATTEPDCGPAFDGSATPVNIIAANIYEHLRDIASTEVEALRESWEELCDDDPDSAPSFEEYVSRYDDDPTLDLGSVDYPDGSEG